MSCGGSQDVNANAARISELCEQHGLPVRLGRMGFHMLVTVAKNEGQTQQEAEATARQQLDAHIELMARRRASQAEYEERQAAEKAALVKERRAKYKKIPNDGTDYANARYEVSLGGQVIGQVARSTESVETAASARSSHRWANYRSVQLWRFVPVAGQPHFDGSADESRDEAVADYLAYGPKRLGYALARAVVRGEEPLPD
jgi:hypothetical protein